VKNLNVDVANGVGLSVVLGQMLKRDRYAVSSLFFLVTREPQAAAIDIRASTNAPEYVPNVSKRWSQLSKI